MHCDVTAYTTMNISGAAGACPHSPVLAPLTTSPHIVHPAVLLLQIMLTCYSGAMLSKIVESKL